MFIFATPSLPMLSKKLLIKIRKPAVYLSTFLRLSAPFLIFYSPLAAIAASFFLDGIDGLIFSWAGVDLNKYEQIDKLLDLYWYFFILAFLFFYPPAPFIFKLLMIFFIWRLIGEILFVLKGKRKILIVFPNLFEAFFWVYIILNKLGQSAFLRSPLSLAVTLSLLIPLKIGHEYLVHQSRFSFLNFVSGKKILRWKSRP